MSSASVPTADEPDRQTPVPDEATPEQPVVQRAGTPMTDHDQDTDDSDTDDLTPSPGLPGV